MQLVVLAVVASVLYVLVLYLLMRFKAKELRGKGFFVIERFLGLSVLTTLPDVVFPANVMDLIPWLSSRRIHEGILETIRRKQNAGEMVKFVAVVSAYPYVVNVHVIDGALSREASDMLGIIDKDTSKYGVLEFFGRNLVTTRDEEWRRHRKVCTAAFTKSNLRLVRATTVNQVTQLLNKWELARGSNESVSVVLGGEDDLMLTTLGVFGESIFGSEMDVFGQSRQEDSFCSRLMYTNANLHVTLVLPKWMRYVWPVAEKAHSSFEKMESDMKIMLQRARSDTERNDLLSLLARSNQRHEPLTEQEAISDVWMFCLAGMETSAHTIGWAIMRLAFHPDVQQKLYDDVKDLYPIEDLSSDNCPYMYAFVHEVLRLHPAVNALPLLCRKPAVVGGILSMEPGWSFTLDVAGCGMNKDHFPEPEEFRPSRFIDAEGHFFTNSGFVAFNVGPRSCLGKQVALMEISIAIGMLLRKYSVHPVRSYAECSQWISKVTREFQSPTPFRLVPRK